MKKISLVSTTALVAFSAAQAMAAEDINTGVIESAPAGGYEELKNVSGAGNSFINAETGVINVEGEQWGAVAVNGAHAENRGTINISNNYYDTVAFNYAVGMFVGKGSSGMNSGTIVLDGAAGERARAVLNMGGSFINEGLIQISGDDLNGILSDVSNNTGHGIIATSSYVENRGTVSGDANDSIGIRVINFGNTDVDVANTGVNHGKIELTGTNAIGMKAQGERTSAANTGAIIVTDVTGIGMEAANNATISNSGSIIAEGGVAISADATSTVNLDGTGTIIGDINTAGATVNLTNAGKSSQQLVFEAGTIVNVDSANAVYDAATNTVITLDATMVHAQYSQLADVTRLIGQMTDANRGLGLWAAASGAKNEHNGSDRTNQHDVDTFALAGGYNWAHGAEDVIGVTFGYVDTKTSSVALDGKSSGVFAGLKADIERGAARFSFGLNAGYMDGEQTRSVSQNSGDVLSAVGSQKGWFFNPTVSGHMTVATVSGWAIAPGAGVSYASQKIDGYSESGAAGANADVAAQNLGQVTAKLELKASKETSFGFVTLFGGVATDRSVGDKIVDMAVNGNATVLDAGNLNREFAYVGATANKWINENTVIEAGINAAVAGDVKGASGLVNLKVRF